MGPARARHLLATLLALLAARGLAAEGLDPRRGWVVFKQFARKVAEQPDPGVSVQIVSRSLGDVRLYFLRQILEPRGDRLEPIGGVVCAFEFARHLRPPADWEEWSFDHPTFERFVDAVEQHPAFADLVTERPLASDIYWEDA